jgi:hypothetical protein
MSFFSKIDSAAHTFASWAEKELGILHQDAPAIVSVADSILKYVGGAAAIIAGLEGGPAAAEILTVTSRIQTGATALNGLINDYGANPTVASMASSLATNAGALISAAQIKNPVSVAAATNIVNNLTTLATALTTAAAPTPPPVTA